MQRVARLYLCMWAHVLERTDEAANEEPVLWEYYIIKNSAAEPASSSWQISQEWMPGHLQCDPIPGLC